MSALATVADVEAVWRPLSSAEQGVAQAWLDRASALVRASVQNVDTRVAMDDNYRQLAAGVVVDMALRVLKNPEGKRQESIDDYSWTRDNSVAAGNLYLADDELSLLLGVRRRGGAFSIAPGW